VVPSLQHVAIEQKNWVQLQHERVYQSLIVWYEVSDSLWFSYLTAAVEHHTA